MPGKTLLDHLNEAEAFLEALCTGQADVAPQVVPGLIRRQERRVAWYRARLRPQRNARVDPVHDVSLRTPSRPRRQHRGTELPTQAAQDLAGL